MKSVAQLEAEHNSKANDLEAIYVEVNSLVNKELQAIMHYRDAFNKFELKVQRAIAELHQEKATIKQNYQAGE